MSKKKANYQQLDARTHVERRPEMYFGVGALGTVEDRPYNAFDADLKNPTFETGIQSPALQKIIDEVLVNARDQCFRKGSGTKNIWVQHLDDGTIVVHNDGKGIPIKRTRTANNKSVWTPELCGGHLRAGENFDDDNERIVGGKNGVGMKLTNIYSHAFQLETRGQTKLYRQLWKGRMKVCEKPTIERVEKEHPFRGTRILFKPCYDVFGISKDAPSITAFIRRRCVEINATTPKVKVFLNGAEVTTKNLKQYAELFLAGAPSAYLKSDRWECIVAPKPSEDFPSSISFVNGIPTYEGGTHVKAYDAIGKAVAEAVSTKKEVVKARFIREKCITLFVSAIIDRPDFDHQGKTKLTSKKATWGSAPDLSAASVKRAVKAVKEHVQTVCLAKNQDTLSSLSRKKRLFIPKLDDATRAGKKDDCMLILTEGDSAKALAVAGIGAIANGRKTHGVFPLRGKLLNTRDASAGAIQKNAEIMNVTRIMGLQFGAEVPREKLRYKRIMIMTDQDDDGSHIKGLIINFLHSRFPYTLAWPEFVGVFHTPRRRAKKGREVHDFYNDEEYDRWAEGRDLRGWSTKYYKGLGTWTTKDARAMFQDFGSHVRYFDPVAETDADRIVLAFAKARADDRKAWLSAPAPTVTGLAKTVGGFIDNELIHFSHASNHRSIPSVVDGLKPSQRKILWTCLRYNVTQDVRVAQLSGKVSEKAMYHHGESSLQGAIIKMAQDFPGSNNLNLLVPSGQFGTRLANPVGSDAAAPRYIHTRLQDYTAHLFPSHLVLDSVVEDGVSVEPVFYMPVVPLLLVNGSSGIGTGYSTEVLPHALNDVVGAVRACLRGESPPVLRPSWNKFKGTVAVEGSKVTVRGLREAEGQFTRVTELPPGVSTEKMVADVAKKLDVDCVKRGDTENVDLLVEVNSGVPLPNMEKHYLTSNMHCFNHEGYLVKYESTADLLRDYMAVGERVYAKSLEKKRQDLATVARDQKRRKDYIDLFCAPTEAIVYPLQVEQLARLMVAKGWPGEIDDLVDSVRDREKTEAGSLRASEKARKAEEELSVWNEKGWREMWSEDLDHFVSSLGKKK